MGLDAGGVGEFYDLMMYTCFSLFIRMASQNHVCIYVLVPFSSHHAVCQLSI